MEIETRVKLLPFFLEGEFLVPQKVIWLRFFNAKAKKLMQFKGYRVKQSSTILLLMFNVLLPYMSKLKKELKLEIQ